MSRAHGHSPARAPVDQAPSSLVPVLVSFQLRTSAGEPVDRAHGAWTRCVRSFEHALTFPAAGSVPKIAHVTSTHVPGPGRAALSTPACCRSQPLTDTCSVVGQGCRSRAASIAFDVQIKLRSVACAKLCVGCIPTEAPDYVLSSTPWRRRKRVDNTDVIVKVRFAFSLRARNS